MADFRERVNSLFLRNNSLILKIFSLLNSVGNCSRSRCSIAVSCYEIGSLSPEIAIFPVKFPVSREFAWRRVRSTLRRQPTSHSTEECGPINPISARQLRPFVNWLSLYSQFEQLGSEIADSLRPTFEIFPFFGDASQRPGAISTAWCGTQSRSTSSKPHFIAAYEAIQIQAVP